MSSVRRKPAKALLCLVLALSVAAVFLLSSSAVFAETSTSQTRAVKGKYKVDRYLPYRHITGTMSFQGIANITNVNGKEIVSANVTSTELFGDALQYYQKHYEHSVVPYKNLVMYGNNGAFPTCKFMVTFPEGTTIAGTPTATSSTDTITKIVSTVSEDKRTVTFEMNLGHWNDYQGFFQYVKDENNSGKGIQVQIPVTFSDQSSPISVTTKGSCELYKYKNDESKNIISVSSEDTWTINK